MKYTGCLSSGVLQAKSVQGVLQAKSVQTKSVQDSVLILRRLCSRVYVLVVMQYANPLNQVSIVGPLLTHVDVKSVAKVAVHTLECSQQSAF